MPEIRYIDTRGHCTTPLPFTEAVVTGIAPGGGLFVPEQMPKLSLQEIVSLAESSYDKRAAKIYSLFGVDIPDEIVNKLMKEAYGAQFDTEDICPVTSLDETTHILELWHGPTSAFKDMALQCLPRFFSASAQMLRKRGSIDHEFMILVATSGDTGKAALEGFRDIDGIRICVLYPHGGVSDIQYRQMATQRGSNVSVWALQGNFDDCQTGVKAVFSDKAFADELMAEHNIALSSANSINWGRLLPQVVYYVSAYAELVARGSLRAGDLLDVCVPTGNFGNILAAWYAKKIGTPINMLLCASNENRVLTDFITTGIYDISNREFKLTPSPSMDILVSSNLERQLFEITGRNPAKISSWMDDLRDKHKFYVDEDTLCAFQEHFRADFVASDECLSVIGEVFKRYGYLLDPHTAVAYRVAQRLKGDNPVLIASTAHWAKFGENVYRALHGINPKGALPSDVSALSGCDLNRLIAQETHLGETSIPRRLSELDDLPIRFSKVISAQTTAIEEALRGIFCR